MFTLRDLLDQVDVQGYVVVKNIKEDGEVETVFGGGIESLYHKYLDREVAYIYSDDEGDLNIEVRE